MRFGLIKTGFLLIFSLLIIFILFQSNLSNASNFYSEKHEFDSNKSTILLKKMLFKEEKIYFELMVCRRNTKKYAVKAYIQCSDENSKIKKQIVSTFYLRKDGCYNLNLTLINNGEIINYEDILENKCYLTIEGLDLLFQKEIEYLDIKAEIFDIVQNGNFLETTIKIENKGFNHSDLIVSSNAFSNNTMIENFEKLVYLEKNSDTLVLLKNNLSLKTDYLKILILKNNIIIFEEKVYVSQFLSKDYIQKETEIFEETKEESKLDKNGSYPNNQGISKIPEINKGNYLSEKKDDEGSDAELPVQKQNCFNDFHKSIAIYTLLFLSVMLNIILIIRR